MMSESGIDCSSGCREAKIYPSIAKRQRTIMTVVRAPPLIHFRLYAHREIREAGDQGKLNAS